ncbi:MAG TPA: glycosyltransferase family 4 protein [Planctomycetota bacterium]|nr:glycosyltransferase family 4 protein [Planctomycetota bacterium]
MKPGYGPPHPAAVLLIAEPLHAGPAALYAQNLMAGLSRAGIYHPLLTPAAPGLSLLPKEELKFVQAATGLEWLQWRPFVFSRIVAWARQQEAELIHGISEKAAPVCAALAETLNLPCVLSVHDYLGGALGLSGRIRAVIAPSEPMREHLVNDADVPKERVRVIAPGVHIPLLRKSAPRAPGEPEAKLIVSIGDFNQSSDYATFMEAVRVIADKQGEGCSFVVSGEGPQESGLRKFVRELKLDKRVTFCHGHTEQDGLLSEADVYVQTTRREGFAVHALQAMALGVPVVAAVNGAVLELIEDGVTGYLVPPADFAMLSERILTLLNDAALREKIGTAARAAAIAQFSAERMVEATVGVYREVLG